MIQVYSIEINTELPMCIVVLIGETVTPLHIINNKRTHSHHNRDIVVLVDILPRFD